MDTHVFICAVLLITSFTLTDQRSFRRRRGLHVPPISSPSFLRSAVESPPELSPSDRTALYQEEFGSRSLPLRTAVETVPDATFTSKRLPLRDAVEKRPPPYEVDTEPAFRENIIPTTFKAYQPNLFSFGYVGTPVPYAFSPLELYPKTQFSTLQYFRNIIGYQPQSHAFGNFPQRTIYQPERAGKSLHGSSNFFRQNNLIYSGKVDYFKRYDVSVRRVVCYVEGVAVYRKDPFSFTPEDLEPSACTHVIYAFASVDPHTFQIIPRDEEYEIVRGGYLTLMQLKRQNPSLKILISVGGDREEGAHRFSNLVQTTSRRQNFIRSLIPFLEQYSFDGIDLHWLYPGAVEFGGTSGDKINFKLLLQELSEVFKPKRLLLSVTVPAAISKIEEGYDIPTLEQTTDFVNLQAYDFHRDRTPAADHHSVLKPRPQDDGLEIQNNVDYAVNYWLKNGLSNQKIVLGIPFFGRSFTLQYTNDTGTGAAIKGLGREGYYTQTPGFLAYFEICDMVLNEGWHRYADASGSPYIVNGDQWVGYESPESIKQKVFYVREKNLGGVFAWAADLDDFKGLCGEKWPLLNSITWHLTANNIAPNTMRPSNPLDSCEVDGIYNDRRDCSSYYICRGGFTYHLKCGANTLFDPNTGKCSYIDPSFCRPGQIIFIPNGLREIDNILRNEKVINNKPKVVCYFTNWAFYRKHEGKFVPEHIDQRLCTHVVYAFATLNPESLLMKEFDPWADLDNNLYQRVTSLQDTTVLLSLGGWTDSAGDKYSRLVNNGGARRKFIIGVVSFLKRHGFKGLHLDWNYPVCWQSNCKNGPASDKNNFNKLIQELRQEFNKESPPLVLAVAVSGYKEVIDAGYNLPELASSLDFMSVMTYDYHGSWERQTGHVSPLYETPGDKYPQYNTNYTLNYIAKQGVPKEKLLVGIPFYGQSFTLAKQNNNHNTGVPATGPGEPGEYTKQPGMLAYYEICNRVRNQRWTVNRDINRAAGPHTYFRDQWVGYDDVESVEEKANYIKSHGFGGAVAWTIDLDDFSNRCCQGTFPLLRSINRGLGLISGIKPEMDCTKPEDPVTPPAPTLTTGVDSGAASSTSTSWPEWSKPTKPTTTERTTTTTKQTTTEWWKPDTPSTTPSTTTSPWWVTQKPTTPSWQIETSTKPPPAVVMPEVDQPQPIKCESGQYYPDNQNCNAYYRCILGELKKQYCAGSLHWNRQTNTCDWPESAKCEQKKPNDVELTTERTTTTTRSTTTTRLTKRTTLHWQTKTTPQSSTFTTESGSTASLQKCENGQYYPHEDCHKYHICVNGQLISQLCAPGLQWNVEESMCDWKHRVYCGDRRVLGQNSQKLIHRHSHKPYSSCSAGMFSAYEGDCSQYLICLWGKFESFTCAEGLHWNDDKKICDWPENAQCTEEQLAGGDIDTPEGVEHMTDHPTKPVKPTEPSDVWKPTTTTKKPTTTTTTETPYEPLPPMSGYYKIVCYFTNWAWYRRGIGKYTPEDINPDLCTHIVYGFAVLDYENLIIKAHDSWADFDNRFYERVTDFKKKGKKVSLALGGWNDSQGDKYSRLANNPAARARFINHALQFLEKYDFDGLDLDWEYPKCWQVDCKKGPDSDKPAFAAWVTEIKEAFKPKGYLLSAAVSPSKTVIDAGYDVPTIAKNLDWVAVMTYDFHGQWDKQTGHVAPLYLHPEDEVAYFNANFSINYWISEGVPRRKIVMGMPLYGQSFQLENAANHGLNAKAPGLGQAGEFTRAAGFLAYYEICDKVKNKGWTVVEDPKRRMGPYAYSGNQWVSYDDQEMIKIKSEFIRQMDLGGGMIWALDLDDFRNRCGEGRHPLLTTIRKVLAAPGKGEIEPVEAEPEEPTVIDESHVPHSTSVTPLVNPNSEFKVVCYFTNWAWYRQGIGKYLPSDIDPNLCTHIVYGFAVLNGDQLIIKPHDTWADFDNKFYEKVTAYKAKGIKVLIAIGGWNDSAGDKYSKLVNNPSARRRFVTHVVEFIEANNFDGLDLDWEYPKCWQVDCNKGPSSDKPAFASLVEELHAAFQPKGWLLSSAVSPSRRVIDAGYDVPALSKYLDWIAVMCYDYHGQWDKVTGHVAPMYAHPEDVDATFNSNFTIHYWIENGADRKKLVMGMPMYGQSFSLANNDDNGLNAPTYGGGEAGEETRARGFLAYYEICSNVQNKGWTVIRDKKGRIGPYAYLRDQWVSFDDIAMIQHKSEYIKAMGLGGGMIWALDLDDFKDVCHCESYPLLKTINRVLRDYATPAPQCILGGPEVRPTKKPTKKPITQEPTYKPPFTAPPYVPPEQPTVPEAPRPCGGEIFVPHKEDCNKYYLCNQGQLQLQACPNGLFWNVGHCDWPENTPCHVDVTTSAPELPEIPVLTEEPQLPEITTVPTPSRPGTTAAPSEEGYKVVCYFTNWAWYRQGEGKYLPSDIDTSLCTHITYGFAVLDSTTLTIKPHDSWADIDNEFYTKVTALRAKGIKVLIAIGGWNDSLGDKYSRLVNNPQARARFITHVIHFIEKWGFDGLDFDWEYPKCWQVDCNKGPDSDKQGFAKLIAELSNAFKSRGWLLSAAVSPSKTVIDAGYDVPTLNKHFDWIAVMTYDFHGHWDKQTGHVAPLYYYPGDTYDYFNANFTLNYWIEKGATPSKLVMGMPLYGQSFSLADASEHGLNAKSYGPGEAGDYTRAGGFLAFYEICERVKRRSWNVVRDPQGRIGPYAYSGNQWVSYDDIAEIKRKSKLVQDLGLGGGMIWALDLDDFRNACGCGRHPLLKMMNHVLRNVPLETNLENCT